MKHFDTLIIGGAVMGSSTAYWLSENPDYDGNIVVIEPDLTYAQSSTALSEASIRHQFSQPVNIKLSMFATEFFSNFHNHVEVNGEAPELPFHETGYLFLASKDGMGNLIDNHQIQKDCGAEVALLSPSEIKKRFPYMRTDDLEGGSLGIKNEGTLDAFSLMQGLKLRARHNGVQYLNDRVISINVDENKGLVREVKLDSGEILSCSRVVNCAGPRSRWIAEMVGLELPVEPRIRAAFVFDCREALNGQTLPLTIDPSGVHVRTNPPHFLAGAPPVNDLEVDPDDFKVRGEEWEENIWPVLAHRIPAFEKIKVRSSWAGHYAYNTLDQNAILGTCETLPNFFFCNGFSGHGFQQSPGVGRGLSELITYGEYRSLDLTELNYSRVLKNEPFLEKAVI
ncbi:MAG: FAD-binding oxidoreductase [Acidimicrobiales bacterium]|jgi:glycine/D-amino acid oxidase-like deaminating enzyme|nr:FAD-binding oxidoreductase [Acidimicrobiales bacterium]HJL91290.1 FAD-binding oxidoreductase [Acidimicrobiales bacterium]HJO41689.1 FAD-binding oxidoreductase [Acidimicrobiales bacterium]